MAGGSFAYGWHSVTHLPHDDQHNGSISSATSSLSHDQQLGSKQYSMADGTSVASAASKQTATEEIYSLSRTNESGQITVTLGEPQLNQLINAAILEQPRVAQILANSGSINTTLNGDHIEAGAVLNLSEIPLDALPSEIQAGIIQLTKTVPILANRDIYIGITGRPQVKDGQITFEQDMNLKLGQFTLPLTDVVSQMGFSTSDIEQRLNNIFSQQALTPETIDIVDDQLILTGTEP